MAEILHSQAEAETRLWRGMHLLQQMERDDQRDTASYEQAQRFWLSLLSAYEQGCDQGFPQEVRWPHSMPWSPSGALPTQERLIS